MSGQPPTAELRLLFITQELDVEGSYMGVAHLWSRVLASRVRSLHVIAAATGATDLPGNVHVHPLGKEEGVERLERWLGLLERCNALIGGRRVDGVLAHMVPAYALAAAPWARLRGVPLVLWYTSHGRSRVLDVARRIVSAGATASPDSYPPGGSPAFVVGHGIDTARFEAPTHPRASGGPPLVGTAGRLTPLKGVHVIIRALARLHEHDESKPRLRIAGAPFYASDHAYLEGLRRLVAELDLDDHVEFAGELSIAEMPGFYGSLDAFISWRARPALDKSGLEALACGVPLITNNTAYASLLGGFAGDFLVGSSPDDLAGGLRSLLALQPALRAAAVERLRQLTVERHGAGGLADRIVRLFAALRAGVAPPFETVASTAGPP